MKRMITLAAVIALAMFAVVGTAEAGKGKGKQNNYASQNSGTKFQSTPKLKPSQNVQWPGQSSQSQSYQGLVSGKQNSYSTQASQTGLSAVPKFGFESIFGWRSGSLGEQVTDVHFGGPASRLGLETGDTIVGVNGQELRTANCWYNAIQRAADQDGWVTLKILDGRTGRMAYRTANLFQLNAR